ncbi:MAG TPA: hypothetical protein VJA18_06885 [Candidatus Nanoarchaeia archaeon]|nr:hypothetical protein [Candidatus Nanoarchaeia archaeon]
MVEDKHDKHDKHTSSLAQKTLLFSLYGLVALMIVFSVMAIQNVGEEGYNRCIQKKCETRGEAFCSKFREINNCCEGAGGNLAVVDNQYKCVFE